MAVSHPPPYAWSVLLSPEFPCDNPALFEPDEDDVVAPRESGIMMVVREAIPETFSIEDELEAILVEEIEIPETVSVEGPVTLETILPPAFDDPFQTLVSALEAVAVACGSPHVASMIPSVLLDATLPSLEPEVLASMIEAGMADASGALTPKFRATVNAWHAILSGTSEDFDACGGAMLDEWCAGMLARLLGTPAKTDALRKDLRARGIAAFGLAA